MRKAFALMAAAALLLLAACGNPQAPAPVIVTTETTIEVTTEMVTETIDEAVLEEVSESVSDEMITEAMTHAVGATERAAERTTMAIPATHAAGTTARQATVTTRVTATTAPAPATSARTTAARPVFTAAAATTTTRQATTVAATTTTIPPPTAPPVNIPQPPPQASVSFAIDASAAVAAGNEHALQHFPSGVVLPARTMALNSGESVFDLLRRSGVELRYQRSFLGVYVSSIAGLRERSAGPNSGWVFEVNGARPGMGSDRFTPNPGDVIVWRFVLSI